MQKFFIIIIATLFITSCSQSTSTQTGKITTARTNVTIDASRWDVTDYKGLVALQCKPRRCSSFERIVFLPTIKSKLVYKGFSENSINNEQAKRLVARLVPERVNVRSASVRKSGNNYVINANFDTGYTGGTLKNVGRIVIEPTRYYGVVGVSPSRGTSRRLMNTGFRNRR